MGAQGRGGGGAQLLCPSWCRDPGSLWLRRENSWLAGGECSGKQSTCPTGCRVRFISGVVLKSRLSAKERGSRALPDCCPPSRGWDAWLVRGCRGGAQGLPRDTHPSASVGKRLFLWEGAKERCAVPNWGSCSASTLHGNTNGVTAYFFFREVGRGPCPDASQHIRAPGREAAPADPSVMPGRQMG